MPSRAACGGRARRGMLWPASPREPGAARRTLDGRRVPAVRDTSRDNETIPLFRLLGAPGTWQHLRTVRLDWPTFHTQGPVKIGDTFFVSSGERIERMVPNGTTTDARSDNVHRGTVHGVSWGSRRLYTLRTSPAGILP